MGGRYTRDNPDHCSNSDIHNITMTCFRHNYRTVANHYNDKGVPDHKSFSGGEWRTEKVCTVCGIEWKGSEYLESLVH